MDREPGHVDPHAELTDATIEALRAGRSAPEGAAQSVVEVVRHLAIVHRPAVPDEVSAAVRDSARSVARRNRWWAVGLRLGAVALAGLFVMQGFPSLFASEDLAEFLGLLHEPHIYQEVGILALSVALGLLVAAVRLKLLPGILAVALPAAIGLGVFGMVELPHAPNPQAELLHIGQAIAAVCLGLLWFLWRRRGRDVSGVGSKR